MNIYHFCSEVHIQSIMETGLLFGKIPIISGSGNLKEFMSPAQWLTLNYDFDQAWCKYSTLPYDRNDYRITINICKQDPLLFRWTNLCKQQKFKHSAKQLNQFGDPENWYVYLGTIHPDQFINITANPKR